MFQVFKVLKHFKFEIGLTKTFQQFLIISLNFVENVCFCYVKMYVFGLPF